MTGVKKNQFMAHTQPSTTTITILSKMSATTTSTTTTHAPRSIGDFTKNPHPTWAEIGSLLSTFNIPNSVDYWLCSVSLSPAPSKSYTERYLLAFPMLSPPLPLPFQRLSLFFPGICSVLFLPFLSVHPLPSLHSTNHPKLCFRRGGYFFSTNTTKGGREKRNLQFF